MLFSIRLNVAFAPTRYQYTYLNLHFKKLEIRNYDEACVTEWPHLGAWFLREGWKSASEERAREWKFGLRDLNDTKFAFPAQSLRVHRSTEWIWKKKKDFSKRYLRRD